MKILHYDPLSTSGEQNERFILFLPEATTNGAAGLGDKQKYLLNSLKLHLAI